MHRRAICIVCSCLAGTAAAEQTRPLSEARAVIRRLLASPAPTAAPGFRANVQVPPGQLYDPLQLVSANGRILTNDIGGEQGSSGSRIYEMTRFGRLSIVIGLGQTLPVTGFDIAPADFGVFGGELLALTQPAVSVAGLNAPHLVQQLTPQGARLICTLPQHGTTNGGVPGVGVEARFGPAGSAFAGKLFLVTFGNNTIYQMTADGACVPFTDFDAQQFGGPSGIAFTPDGAEMLVSVARGSDFDPGSHMEGAILRVLPGGHVLPEPYATGFRRPTGMAFAPPGFGHYAGELFVTDTGNPQVPVPMTQALERDGRVLRVDASRQPQTVAEGLVNPGGALFAGDTLWISDMNGNFIGGRRELPDGLLVTITLDNRPLRDGE